MDICLRLQKCVDLMDTVIQAINCIQDNLSAEGNVDLCCDLCENICAAIHAVTSLTKEVEFALMGSDLLVNYDTLRGQVSGLLDELKKSPENKQLDFGDICKTANMIIEDMTRCMLPYLNI